MHITITDSAPDRNIYSVSGCSKDELDNKMNLFFSSEGYRLRSTATEIRVYEKGNRALRLLFGAFAKYHKQSVTIKPDGNGFQILLHKDSTGVSGGLIGMNQVKKEFARVSTDFMNYFTH
jgi:hypothetical protein